MVPGETGKIGQVVVNHVLVGTKPEHGFVTILQLRIMVLTVRVMIRTLKLWVIITFSYSEKIKLVMNSLVQVSNLKYSSRVMPMYDKNQSIAISHLTLIF